MTDTKKVIPGTYYHKGVRGIGKAHVIVYEDGTGTYFNRRGEQFPQSEANVRFRIFNQGLTYRMETEREHVEQVDVSPVDRLNVALIPKGAAAMAQLEASLGLTKTDITNRALSAYAWLEQQTAEGARIVVENPTGATQEIRFL